MKFKNLYLPLGLIIAVILALILPSIGSKIKEEDAIPLFIFIIFLVNGIQFKFSEITFDKKLVLGFILTFIISLILSPLLGYGAIKLISMPFGCALGVIVMSAVPPTLSSAIVITEQSGGNTAWSILLTISMNLLGVVLIPFTLGIILNSGIDFKIDPYPLLKKLILLVLIPFICGIIVNRFLKISEVKRVMKVLSYIPSTCVILTVYASLGFSRETLLNTPISLIPLIIFSVIGIHLCLFLIAQLSASFFKLEVADKKAVIFVASQKTLPVAISVLAVLNDKTGQALIVCLFFHFSQLMIDSLIATRMKRSMVA